MDDLDLFQTLSKEEYEKLQPVPKPKAVSRKRKVVTEPRNNTTWYGLPHQQEFQFCTCPAHEEIQHMLKPGQKAYRDKYPVRMVYEIQPGMLICRDCFINEGDKLAED